MSRVLGLCCVKNEADRYLTESLAWHLGFLDDVLVYDDRSNDQTVEIAENSGAVVVVRETHEPSFLQHEGLFRQNAFRALEAELYPTENDWVLSFDADEFLMSPRSVDPRMLLQHATSLACTCGPLGYRFKVNEVFDVDDTGTPMIRTDGYWDDINELRFFRYQDGGVYAEKRMASGSAPTYVDDSHLYGSLNILHFGYARKDDRVDKHNRYYGLPGHSAEHIESIISTPTLKPWTGLVPF